MRGARDTPNRGPRNAIGRTSVPAALSVKVSCLFDFNIDPVAAVWPIYDTTVCLPPFLAWQIFLFRNSDNRCFIFFNVAHADTSASGVTTMASTTTRQAGQGLQ